MRIELILLLGAGFIMANIYYEGKLVKKLFTYKKYYQMAGVAFGAFVLYWLIKKNPKKANEMIATSNDYLKYMPIDQNSSKIISPILDFTAKQSFFNESSVGGGSAAATATAASAMGLNPILGLGGNQTNTQENRIMHSGKKATKRSVSETKKKFVASRQQWKCGDCGEQLNAWFEVDHKVRLEYGGSNHIDNLVALCRECHGKKTTIENL